jgi:hypothetical protein
MLRDAGAANVTHTTDPFQVARCIGRTGTLILLDADAGQKRLSGHAGVNAVESDATRRCWRSVRAVIQSARVKSRGQGFHQQAFDVEEVLTRIRNMLEIRLLHEDARSAANSLETSRGNPLTGLGNRRLLTAHFGGDGQCAPHQERDGSRLPRSRRLQRSTTPRPRSGDALSSRLRGARIGGARRRHVTGASAAMFMIALWHVATRATSPS